MKKWYTATFVRYFISYFIVIVILVMSFIIVTKSQMTRTYTETLNSNIEQRIDITRDRFFNEMESIIRIDSLLKGSEYLVNYRYAPNNTNRRLLYGLMDNLADSSGFIESITYLDKKSGDVISTKYIVKYENNFCDFFTGDRKYESFNLYEIEEDDNSSLIFLEGTDTVCFLYIPTKTRDDYAILYSIDLFELNEVLKDNIIDGMDALVMINEDISCVYGVHQEMIEGNISSIPEESGMYPWNEERSLYVYKGIYEKYSLAALVSKQYVKDQINAAMRASYLFLAIIGLAGLVLICMSMSLTYFPLRRLIQKVIPKPETGKNFIVQLETTFSTAMEEIERLQNKIDKYHLSIQKSLLDAGIESSMGISYSGIENIDKVFRTDRANNLYVLRICFKEPSLDETKVCRFLKTGLPDGSDFISLESGNDYRVFVVNYGKSIDDNDDAISMMLKSLCMEFGCFCAVSNRVFSLTDIPEAYENSLLASEYWPDIPVVVYSCMDKEQVKKNEAGYPYKLLTVFSDSLDRLDFTESEVVLKHLMVRIDSLSVKDSKYPDFIVRCLLIDILMALFSSMNKHNVRYDTYKDLYYETLFCCRSCGWQEKNEEIICNMKRLLELFRVEQSRIRANQIQEYLEQNYASPELDVTALADYFHVNSVYMSYVIKKELGETFVNYLWKLRLQRATDLLLNTDLPIDTISLQVGYENASSFRRKFKQETGLTPSQFRERGVFQDGTP